MMHPGRRWGLTEAPSAPWLAHQLAEHTWTACTGFRFGDVLFLNDSTSPDGAQEYAVFVPAARRARGLPRWRQIESLTFSWMDEERALVQIQYAAFDVQRRDVGFWRKPIELQVDEPGAHGTCVRCA